MEERPKLTILEAAAQVLKERGESHYKDVAREIQARGLASLSGKTPWATVGARINSSINRHGESSEFVRLAPGVFGIRDDRSPAQGARGDTTRATEVAIDSDIAAPQGEADRRVRIRYFPVYDEVRHLLRVLPGWPVDQVTRLRRTLLSLGGTPRNAVDWRDPDKWIPARLEGDNLALANAIWVDSGGMVNPRHTFGHWFLCQKYELLDDVGGTLRLTQRGQSFLGNEQGEVEAYIDEQEGVARILSLVAVRGPTRANGVLEDWSDYLAKHSGFGTPSTRRDTLWRRLRNLVSRGLVSRKGAIYNATESGLAYLERVGSGAGEGDHDGEDLLRQARKHSEKVREELRAELLAMDPFAFEHLVKRLLEDLDYQNVEVTKRSADGGVDVIGEIELGISSVKEVVQAKRHQRKIQRNVLDALRGSLHRFAAVRGTIITTSEFSKGTKEAAFEPGVAPITLVDGNKLIDLLIEHNIGVRKRKIEVLAVDTEAFDDFGRDG